MRIGEPVRVGIFSGSWARKNQEFIYLNGKMDRWSLVEVKVKPCRTQGKFNAFTYLQWQDDLGVDDYRRIW